MGIRRIRSRARAYTLDQNGTKSIPVSPETLELIQEQQAAFRQKFGREPGPNDPIFFDPDADTPQPMNVEAYKQAMIKMMGDAGLPGDLIYAFQKTGRLVSEGNQKFLTDAELKEWNDAVAEYYEQEGKQRV
jgi:hypothetical protein